MTDTERRERYAAAMYGPAAPHHITPEGWATVDAAMDVADVEVRIWQSNYSEALDGCTQLVEENDRLCAEIRRLKHDLCRETQLADDATRRELEAHYFVDQAHQELVAAHKDADETHSDLTEWQEYAQTLEHDVVALQTDIDAIRRWATDASDGHGADSSDLWEILWRGDQ